MRILEIKVDSAWVLKHRGDDELPMQRLAAVLQDDVPSNIFWHWDVQLDELFVELNVDWTKAEWEKRVLQKLQSEYADWRESEVTVNVLDGERQKEECDEDDDTYGDGTLDDILDDILALSDDENAKGETQSSQGGGDKTEGWKLNEAKVQKRMAEIEALMGAEEFKVLAKEFVTIAPQIVENKTYEIFSYQSYLFSINNGFGLTTCLKAIAELLNAIHIQEVCTKEIREIILPSPKGETDEPFDEARRCLREKPNSGVDIICLDISEWMGNLDSRPFKAFLEFVETRVNEHIVVFRVPFVDREVLERIRNSLNDIMYVRTVAFPPLGVDDLVDWGAKELEKYGFQLSKEAKPYLHERLMMERSDGKFYGLNTVRKVVRELLYKKQLRNARKPNLTKTISAADAKLICGEVDKKLTGEQMLAEMVGGEKMKEQIAAIVSQIEMSREDGVNAPCIHMRFVGNPGTGKTTVARIIGKMLKEKGLLRIGNFYEYAGRDFCGRYIGETAPKTASMCRDAYGSVLFIDEAYALYRGDGNDRDYGKEAIDTLIAEMENHRHDLVVIMAGYADEMQTLMKGNTGLASRMPYLIEFPNFTREELYRIFKNMSEKKWQCEEGYLEEARKYFDNLPDAVLSSKEFANARFVRNLYERTWAKALLRGQLHKTVTKTLTKDDFLRAAADKEFAFNEKKRTRLGFYEE